MRHGVLMIEEADMHEYTFYVNGGSKMSDIMRALVVAAGCRGSAFVLQ